MLTKRVCQCTALFSRYHLTLPEIAFYVLIAKGRSGDSRRQIHGCTQCGNLCVGWTNPDWCYIPITLIFRLLTDAPDATRTESSRNLSEMAWLHQPSVDSRSLAEDTRTTRLRLPLGTSR